MTARDLRRAQVTSIDRKLPGSSCRRPKTGVYCTFHFLQGCSLQEEAVTWQEMTSRDLSWPEVTRKWRNLTERHLELAVEVRKLAYTVHLTSYKAVACRRNQSRDRKWRHVTVSDPEVTWFDRKSPGSGCGNFKTGVYCTFHSLQACSLQEEEITWQEMTWCDLRWPEVTQKWRHLTGSHLEVAVEVRKLAYTVHFTSSKAVARRRRQWRERKRRHVTSSDCKWLGSDVIWPEVSWKWQ